jgi:hypothetical protein
MYGGNSMVGGGLMSDAWELDDTTWTELQPTAPPIARRDHVMAYDAELARFVVFGGYDNGYLGDTWTLGYEPLVAGEACASDVDYDGDGLRGCADDECWGVCAPVCNVSAQLGACSLDPRCGDGVCEAVETCRDCPADCPTGSPACLIECGDFECDAPTETVASCPGDCS